MKNLAALVVVAYLVANPVDVGAQQAAAVSRIGFLSPYSADYDREWRVALQQGLRELGYIEGKNLQIEYRHADGKLEKLAELAQDLVRRKVDIFVVHGFPNAIQAARQAGRSIPIVFVANPDPAGAGIVASLARPGGNVTGLSDLHSEIAGKRLELLKELLPSASRIAVMVNPNVPVMVRQVKDVQALAPHCS